METMSAWHPTQGGGFMNETTGMDSPSTKGFKKDGVRRSQSIIPLCARQINGLKGDSEFKLFNYRLKMIHIVGIVKEIEEQLGKIQYTIEDHTGTIKAVWWLEATEQGEQSLNIPEAKEGAYVQVFGTLKDQDGDKTIMLLKMILIEDANIITTHLLEIINTRLQAQHNKPAVSARPRLGAELINSMTRCEDDKDSAVPNFTPVQQKVYDIIKAGGNTDSGPSISTIVSHFQQNQKNEARDVLDFLVSEGHVYSTVDDNHFKATTNSS